MEDATIPVLADPFTALGRLRHGLTSLRHGVRRHQVESVPPPLYDYRGGAARGSDLRCRALVQYEPWAHQGSEADVTRLARFHLAKTVHIARALNRLGYVVDVIDWRDTRFKPQHGYDALVGMGPNFAPVVEKMGGCRRTVYWATRSAPEFEAHALDTRLSFLERRRGIRLSSVRQIEKQRESSAWQLADAVIVVGNETTRSSYLPWTKPIFSVDSPAPGIGWTDTLDGQHDIAPKNFLFLAGFWLAHKGLDLVLEAFASRPDVHLWICAPVQAERDFMKAYRAELFRTGNIHTVGWVEPTSPVMKLVMARCGFFILPSCSEGQAGSALTAISAGLVPLITPQVGLDAPNFGVTIDADDPGGVRNAIDVARMLPMEEWRRRSQAAMARARSHHNFEVFGAKVQELLGRILMAQGESIQQT